MVRSACAGNGRVGNHGVRRPIPSPASTRWGQRTNAQASIVSRPSAISE